jgi:hypothetical protein
MMRIGHTKGESFALLAQTLARAKGSIGMAAEYAERSEHRFPEVSAYYKAAMNAGTLTGADFAGPLSQFQSIGVEFDAAWQGDAMIGRLGGVRRVPPNVRLGVQTGMPMLSFRGPETTTPKPVSALAFDLQELPPRTASVIVALTEELLERANVQGSILDTLRSAVAIGMDRAMLDPSFAGGPDSVQSITNAGIQITPSGSTATTFKTDVTRMAQAVAATISPAVPRYLTAITGPTGMVRIAAMADSGGAAAFPDVRIGAASYLCGMPLLVSPGAVVDGSPSRDLLVIVDAAQLLVAVDPGAVRLSVSGEGSLMMDSAPSAGAQSLLGLWQHNMVALRIETSANWALLRSGAAWMAF